ncbi:MAG TPA: hypothetical protein VJV79_22635 [Polyangiaceae bacterium]|nr:hypothetical protein [Polyangiaceae bacterium]
MTELNDDEALILTQARRALNPTSADERRVLLNLLPQLAPLPDVPGARLTSRSSWTLRAGGAMAVIGAVALSGGLGYQKGFEAGIAQQTQPQPSANPVGVGSAMPEPRGLEPKPLLPPERPLSPTRERAVMPPLPSASKTSAAASAARTRSEPVDPPAVLGLDEEVRQLRRVERAIRERNPRLALVLLEDLDHAIPAGQLLEERRAASIMANCQLGADAAVANAQAFVANHAGSAYLNRVIEICELESERNSAAPGTHVPR